MTQQTKHNPEDLAYRLLKYHQGAYDTAERSHGSEVGAIILDDLRDLASGDVSADSLRRQLVQEQDPRWDCYWDQYVDFLEDMLSHGKEHVMDINTLCEVYEVADESALIIYQTCTVENLAARIGKQWIVDCDIHKWDFAYKEPYMDHLRSRIAMLAARSWLFDCI
jgi:hypothetical protein